MSNFGFVESPAQATITNDDVTRALVAQSLFPSLLPFVWRDVGFPYSDTRMTVRQDLVIHRFADLDGADVESTGRHPIEISARIPFLNNIERAPIEVWPNGDLFPFQLRKFFAAITDGSGGYLQHPIFGPIYCKPSHYEIDMKASTRDGVWVEATWIETFEPGGGVSPNVSQAGNVAAGIQAGIDLDTLLPNLDPSSFPHLPPQTYSYADFARSIQGVSDTVSLLEYQTAGKVDAVIAQTQNTLDSISQATGNPTDAANSVQAYPTREAADRFITALANVRQSLLSTGQQIGLYWTGQRATSLAMLAQVIPSPVADLMALNPALIQQFVVPRYTQVRYYAANSTRVKANK